MSNEQIRLSECYRDENDFEDGVVILFGCEVVGWINELRDPQRWEPGSVAITVDHSVYVAVGGTSYGGAEKWVLGNHVR